MNWLVRDGLIKDRWIKDELVENEFVTAISPFPKSFTDDDHYCNFHDRSKLITQSLANSSGLGEHLQASLLSSSPGWAKYVMRSSRQPTISARLTALKKPECLLDDVMSSSPLMNWLNSIVHFLITPAVRASSS